MPGRVGQTGRRAVVGVAVVAALALLAAAALSATVGSLSHADTVLQDVVAATVVPPGGTPHPGTPGEVVPPGAAVRTAGTGSAALVTAGRVVRLAAATEVTVGDGAHQRLDSGRVLVDARHAPALDLATGLATVYAERGSLVRVERDALLRVGAYAGAAAVQAVDRAARARVPALYQVQVPFGGVPGRVTPLVLAHDGWERRYALDLLTADLDLSALATALAGDAPGRRALLQTWPVSDQAAGPLPGAEQALAVAVAQAASSRPASQRYTRVVGLRAAGGSWGVVAALVGAAVAQVSAAIDRALQPVTVLAAGPSVGPVLPPAPTPTPTGVRPSGGPVAAPPAPPAGGTGGGSPAGPSGSGSGSPGGSPAGTPSPVPDLVQQVVATVVGLLPTPAPVPTPTVTPPALPLGGVSLTLP